MKVGNSICIRLSTDSFLPEKVGFLCEKLREKGIMCRRKNENRIYIEAKGIPLFFSFIGNKSPIKCYDYKFDIDEWRFSAKRMKDVSDELNIDYSHLSYLVKIGKIECYRASKNGKPRFLPENIEKLKNYIKGEMTHEE